jgi:MFS family permease
LIVAIVFLVLFVLRERQAKFPMLDLTLFAIRAFRTGTLAAMLSFISLFCTTVMMPFFMMEALHYSASTTGYVMAAYPLTMVLTAPISGAISDKIGPFWLTTSGLLLNVLGFILLNSLSTTVAPWLVALHMAIFGIGQGMFQSPNNAAVMGSVDKARLSVASGINALVRNIGMVLGISLSVLLFSYQMFLLTGRFVQVGVEVVDPKAFLTSLHTVFYAAALAALLGAIASVRRRRSPSSKQNA